MLASTMQISNNKPTNPHPHSTHRMRDEGGPEDSTQPRNPPTNTRRRTPDRPDPSGPNSVPTPPPPATAPGSTPTQPMSHKLTRRADSTEARPPPRMVLHRRFH